MTVIFSRRHLTYLLLVVPVVVYLALVVCMMARIFPRSSPDPTDSEYREKYQALLKLLQNRAVGGDQRLGSEYLSADHRKLLDLDAMRRNPEYPEGKVFGATLEQLLQNSGGNLYWRPGENPDHAGKDSESNPVSDIHSWKLKGTDRLSEYDDIARSSKSHKETIGRYPLPVKSQNRHIHNCSTISSMRLRTQIGHGVSKQAFLADYQGTEVVIKMVTRHVLQVKNCLKRLREVKMVMNRHGDSAAGRPNNSDSLVSSFKNIVDAHKPGPYSNRTEAVPTRANVKERRQGGPEGQISEGRGTREFYQVDLTPAERQNCYIPSTARVMKEILLTEQLHHPNLASMLGYCVRSEETDTTDISEHGVVSVFERGSSFALDSLQILPWPSRLRHAREMASLLLYLELSPLGSLVVPDFKEGHLLMVKDSIKLIDLDDVNSLEPECRVKPGPNTEECPYGLRCSRALCEGFNAKENLKNMNRLVLKRLLFPTTFPSHVIPEVGQLNADLDTLKLTAGQLLERLERIQALAETQDPT